MTYPHPSETYTELVCTAGITKAHEWVRLYRLTIATVLLNNGLRNTSGSNLIWGQAEQEMTIGQRAVGPTLTPSSSLVRGSLRSGTGSSGERSLTRCRSTHSTSYELNTRWTRRRTVSPVSLGIVRPKRVVDVVVEPVEGDWKELEKLGSAEKAAESVRKKCLQMVADDRDARFFVGTGFSVQHMDRIGCVLACQRATGPLGRVVTKATRCVANLLSARAREGASPASSIAFAIDSGVAFMCMS